MAQNKKINENKKQYSSNFIELIFFILCFLMCLFTSCASHKNIKNTLKEPTSDSEWGYNYLCSKHKDGVWTADIGVCKNCGRGTSSGMFKLCNYCAGKLKKCRFCEKDLK